MKYIRMRQGQVNSLRDAGLWLMYYAYTFGMFVSAMLWLSQGDLFGFVPMIVVVLIEMRRPDEIA